LLANRNGASENQMNPSPRFTTMRPESEDGSDSLSPVDFLYLKRFLYLALRKNGFNKAEAIPCDPKNQSTHRHFKKRGFLSTGAKHFGRRDAHVDVGNAVRSWN